MKNKNVLTFLTLIEHLVQSYLERAINLVRLASLEGRLAGKSFLRLIVLYFVLGVLLIATWLSLLAVLFIGIISIPIQHSWLIASLAVAMLNLSLLATAWIFILKAKKNMTFPATRRQLSTPTKHTTKNRRTLSHARTKTKD